MIRVGYAVAVVAGLALPWLLSGVPFLPLPLALPVRVGGVVVTAVLAMGLTIWGWWSVRAGVLWLGAWCAGVTGAILWISLLSFSAEVSKFVYFPWLLGVAVVSVPWVVSIPAGWRRRRLLPLRVWSTGPFLIIALCFLLAPPARRYAEPHRMEEIQALALPDARENMRWVMENIERRSAPFTDTARDTIRRGYAECGGMSNVLYHLLRAQQIPARIVHFSRGRRIHTLVEYWDADADRWILMDPDKGLHGADYGGLSAVDVMLKQHPDTPEGWRGYASLYYYVAGRGYRPVEK